MAANRLVLNTDQTHLMVMAYSSQHSMHRNYNVELVTGNEIIFPEAHGDLLGCKIHCNFLWKKRLQDNKLSIHRHLTSRINTLKKISYGASFQTKNMVINGVVILRIIYTIQLWGGTKEYVLSMLQILQNLAARFVTKNYFYTAGG